jgi:hypothetical protein
MTNRSSDIEAAWLTAIWQNATFTALNSQALFYDVTVDSGSDAAALRLLGVVDFFTCLTLRQSVAGMVQSREITYQVVVTRYLQQTDSAQSTYLTVRNNLEVVDDLVLSSLGPSWSNTVGFYNGGRPSQITTVTIDGVKCWKGSMTYAAQKQI